MPFLGHFTTHPLSQNRRNLICKFGLALALRLRASSRTKVLILSRKNRGGRIIPPAGGLCKFGFGPRAALARGQSNSKPAPHNRALTTRDSQRDSQSANSIPDHDLQRIISAWCNLPANLKAAIVAIVGSG
jgi:hypothetical protein